MASAPVDRAGWAPAPILTDAADHEAGKTALQRLSDELNEPGKTPLETAMRRNDATTLSQRDVMCLGHSALEAEVLADGRLLVRGSAGPLMFAPSKFVENAATARCTAEVYISPSGFFKAVVISQDRGSVATIVVESLVLSEDEVKRALSSYLVDRERNAADNMAFERFLTAYASGSEADHLIAHVAESCGELATLIYVPKALVLSPQEREDELRTLMGTNGFLPLVGDVVTLRQVAALSLAASLSADRSKVELAVRSAGNDPAVAILACEHIEAAFGWPLLIKEDDVLCPTSRRRRQGVAHTWETGIAPGARGSIEPTFDRRKEGNFRRALNSSDSATEHVPLKPDVTFRKARERTAPVVAWQKEKPATK